MTTIDREVKHKLEEVSKKLLGGQVKDYTEYARFSERYKVLKEIDDFLADSRKADAEDGELTADAEK